MKAAAALLLCLALAASASAAPPELGLPIACDIGKTCWVQQYFDHDSTAGARDYACGSETYDGHDGTDFRIRDTASHADVIASAAGVVKAVRDGVADHLVESDADRAAVHNRECGNGVVVDHGDGWQTQYCHLRMGSVAVKPGDRVARGARLGEVGFSGLAAFPHVHLTVRRDGGSLDPFRGSAETAEACGGPANALWSADTLAGLSYRQGDIIAFGFAPGAVDVARLESGTLTDTSPASNWPAMVAYLWAINLSAGDGVTVSLDGPGGITAKNTVTLDRAKAQYLLFAGVKMPPQGWPSGIYQGRIAIGSGSAARLAQHWSFALD